MFAIVSDTGCGLTDEFVREREIFLVGLKIFLGRNEYEDGRIGKDEFYKRILKGEEVRTSHPSPVKFEGLYRSIFEKGYDEILSFHLSSKASGLFNAARLAAQKVDPEKIHVVDSLQLSASAYMLLRRLLEFTDGGTALSEAIKKIGTMRENSGLFFTISSLDYLVKNGRIGKATNLIGSILKLRPILTVKDGEIGSAAVSRGEKKLYSRMAGMCADFVRGKKNVRFVFGYSEMKTIDTMRELKKAVAEAIPELEDFPQEILRIWPTIGAHTGPTVVGVSCYGE